MYVDTSAENPEPQYLVSGDSFHLPEGLAVDHVASNVYFTDSHADTDGRSYVGVANMKSGKWAKV